MKRIITAILAFTLMCSLSCYREREEDIGRLRLIGSGARFTYAYQGSLTNRADNHLRVYILHDKASGRDYLVMWGNEPAVTLMAEPSK